MDQAEEQHRSVRVLIVEDNVNQLRTLVDIVELEGFPVVACSTAKEALTLAQRERFGVVIMDLRLPDDDGVHLLEQLRALDSNQRIIINTGFASLDSAKEAVNLGAFAYVEKARDPEELIRHVHRAHAVYWSLYTKELEFAVAERTAALHKSESDYRILMEQSADGIFISDGQGNFTLVNAEAGRMLGYTRDELERMNVRELVLPEVVPNIAPWLEELSRGAALSIECPLRCKDGVEKIMEVRACLLSDGRIQSNLRDITERKRMEEALQESERFARSVVDALSVRLCVLDENGFIVAANKAWRDYAVANASEAVQTAEGVNYLAICDAVTDEFAEEAATCAAGIRAVLHGKRSSFIHEYFCPSLTQHGWSVCRVSRFVGDGPVRVVVAHEDITERKLAEEALRESEALFRTLAETSEAGIIILRDEKIEYCNPALQRRSGYSYEELDAMPFWQLAAPEFREPLQLLNAVLQQDGEIPSHYELKILTKEGEERWIQASIGISQFHGQRAALAVTMDITERKKAEEALRESELLFRTLAETSQAGIVIVQGEELVYHNPAIERMNGYSREELETRPFWFIFPEESQDAILRSSLARQRGENPSAIVELKFFTKTGKERWMRVALAPLSYRGKPASLGVSIDITDRKLVEEALRESEELFRTLAETSGAGILISRGDTTLYANPAFSQQSGYSRAELLAMPPWGSLAPEFREKIEQRACARQGWAGEEFLLHEDLRLITKDGIEKWIHVSRAAVVLQGETAAISIILDMTERRRIEEEQRASEELFRTLAETSQAGIFIVQGEQMVYVNPALERIGGFTREEYLTMPFWAAVAPEFHERIKQYGLARQRGEEVPSHYELRVVSKTGEERWVHASMATIRYRGKPAGLGTVLDITDRREMEDELRASEARFRSTFEQAAVGMAHVSLEGRFFLVNQKLCDILGYAEDELQQMSCYDLTHPDDRTAIMRETQRVMAGETSSFVLEKRCLHKSGAVVWMTLTSALVRGANNEPLYFVDVIEDISARKQIEAEQQCLVAILENTTDFIVTTTVEGRGVYMNRAGRALMGLSANTDLGEWVSENAYTTQSREMVVRQAIPTALRTGAWAGEAVAVSYLGEEIPISQVIVAHKDEQGRAQYLSVLARDISEQKKAEAFFHALPRELLAAQEHERRRIAHELHDEIGQVLTAIKINLQTIQRTPEVFADRMEESVHLVENALQQVRTLSLDLRPPMLDDLGLIAALRWHLDQRAQRSGLSIQFITDAETIRPPQEIAVVCFRIVQEALTNVVRHAHARQVFVELWQDHEALHLRVRNDGETFDVNKARARARRGESTGLVGMQERAQMVGGRVDILSYKGKGTEVRVWLPLSTAEARNNNGSGK